MSLWAIENAPLAGLAISAPSPMSSVIFFSRQAHRLSQTGGKKPSEPASRHSSFLAQARASKRLVQDFGCQNSLEFRWGMAILARGKKSFSTGAF